jgi:hypothetical protein
VEDVEQLGAALEQSQDDAAAAAMVFQAQRQADAAALAKLVQVRAPSPGSGCCFYCCCSCCRRAPATTQNHQSARCARVLQIGYPWQYMQSQINSKLWTLRFLVLMALNKVAPALFSPPIFLMIQQHELSYSTILARAQATSRRLAALVGAVLVGLAALLVRRAMAGGAAA